MSYSVSWRPPAEQQLTAIWLSARDRKRITDAIKRLEEALRRDPHTAGESRELDERIVFIDPLAVNISIDALRQSVQIRSIRRTR